MSEENKNREMIFSVYRYNPEKDNEPFIEEFPLKSDEIDGHMLLNALETIKEKLDPSLTFRRSCREGVCGSDGMNINGKNNLACKVSLASLPNKVLVQPLPGFPVVKDLVVDMEEFFNQYESIEPYVKSDQMPEKGEFIQTPKDRAKLDGLYECILCACCSASCPSYWWNPDKFLGPATLLASYRFVVDSRDDYKKERLSQLGDPYKLYRCHSIQNCSYVCPKGLNPTKAIGHLRKEMLKDS